MELVAFREIDLLSNACSVIHFLKAGLYRGNGGTWSPGLQADFAGAE